MRSISGGQFSPIPKGLMEKMAGLNLKKQGNSVFGQGLSRNSPQQPSAQKFNPIQTTEQLVIQKNQGPMSSTQIRKNANST